MARRFHRAASSLSTLADPEVADRAVGGGAPARTRPLELVPSRPPPSPEIKAYLRRFPTVPAWFAGLDPEDLVTGVDTANFPCMADAEDGEQPWNYIPFPFVGPPDNALVD